MSRQWKKNRVFSSRDRSTIVAGTLLALVHLGCNPSKGPGPNGPRTEGSDAKPVQEQIDYRLSDITREAGIEFVHNPGPPSFFFPAILGSGAALIDIDQDGRMDIFLRNGTSGPPHQAHGKDEPPTPSRLYHQQPDGRFTDATGSSGLGDTGYGMGVAVGDVNNDGYPDVYAVNFRGDRLYVNQRDGTFVDVTEESGIDNVEWGSSATFLDFDRDGWLDLFVTNYVDYSRPKPCSLSSGREDFCNPSEFLPTRDRLYRNVTGSVPGSAKVRFEDVTTTSGIGGSMGPGLGVRAGDFDADGWPDLFVANDGRADFMWMNQRNGTFRDMAIPLGTAYNSLGRPTASMGIAEGDVDNDGHFDLMVTNLRGESNTLFRKMQDGFDDVTASAGLRGASYPHTGFGISFSDMDHNGTLDLILANGHVYQSLDRPAVRPAAGSSHDSPAARQFWQMYADTKQLLLGDGAGRFQDVSDRTGDFGATPEVSRSLAVGDLDGDGDLDLLFTNIGSAPQLFRNDLNKAGHWLVVRAIDPRLGGRDAYGAVIELQAGGRKWIRRIQPGSSFQASDDPRAHFGLGPVGAIDGITVVWPDGTTEGEVFSGGPADQVRTIRRGDGKVNGEP